MYESIMPWSVSLVAVGGLVAVCVLFYRALRSIQMDNKSLVEQAFNHLRSENSAEAVNAIGALEYNRKVVEQMNEEPETKTKNDDTTIIRDIEHGKEYELIGGPV